MEPTGTELMAPDDLDALSVHADALMERGNFLGEVIATQLELHKLGEDDLEKRTRLATESRRLLGMHHQELFGSLAPHALSIVPKAKGEHTGQFAACTASWWLGVIDEVALTASSKMALAETIPALARVPAARFLRSMVCGSSAPPSARFAPVSYDRFVVALIEHASAFPRLRALFLGDLGEGRVASAAGSLDPVYAALPKLEVLRVHADRVDLGAFALPNLRELELVGDHVSLMTLSRVRGARLHELASATIDSLRSENVFEEALDCMSTLPRLERLALRGMLGTDKISQLLAFPRLAQLKALDLSRCALHTEMQALVDHADRLAHIEKLDLRFNDFSNDPDLFRELRARLPRANVAGQTSERQLRGPRYDAIEE